MASHTPARRRVCIVGSGTCFLSGISYYTHRLTGALAERHDVSTILMRRLLPVWLYPGRDRVGAPLTELTYCVPVFDGVDWYWLPSIVGALVFLARHRPKLLVLQWWTGTVLHSYLLLALVARLLGARIVIEFHELLDTAELRIAAARAYVRILAPLLLRLADGFVVHSEFDRAALSQRYPLAGRPLVLIPHGPYDQYRKPQKAAAHRDDGVCHLLYFGVIRPFKGLEDLIAAFDLLSDAAAARFDLTVVGEIWEGWTLPAEMIARSRHRERIRFVNRYVSDAEVAGFFSAADAVVLPYHRSSASGPLHVAMSYGLPVIVTRVGGLVEAVNGYAGAVLIPPHDPAAIRAAFDQVAALRGRRFADPHSWERTAARYDQLFDAILGAASAVSPAAP